MHKDAVIHIIGAGIGGLSTALALRQQGFEPVLFEQAPRLGEVGAGLTIGPNASRVLSALGLEKRLQELAREPRHTGMLHFKTGQALKVETRGSHYREQFGAPFWHIHRADMIQLLTEGLDNPNSIRFNHRLASIEQEAGSVLTRFTNGQEYECDVLLACDGLKSPVRNQLFDHSEPEFTGFVAWRGLVNREAVAQHAIEPDFTIFPGPQAMVGRYAVRDRGLVNFVAIASQDNWNREGWMEPANLDEMRERFNGWHDAVTDLFEAVDPAACFKWGLHVRQPLQSWVKGRVGLVGDAAHPMTPFLGLGAAMAIEDAMVLARVFADAVEVDEAFSRYQAARVERANHVQRESQKQGLYLLNIPPGQPPDQGLTGEDPLGLFAYDAVNVPV
jgi:salicylate hydroxylase